MADAEDPEAQMLNGTDASLLDFKEAIIHAVNSAIEQIPDDATIGGISVMLAFTTPELQRTAKAAKVLQAVGTFMSVREYAASAVASLFVKYAQHRASILPQEHREQRTDGPTGARGLLLNRPPRGGRPRR